jgi:hypothetical protein
MGTTGLDQQSLDQAVVLTSHLSQSGGAALRLAVVGHGQEPLKLVDPIGQSKWCGLVVSHSCTYRRGHGYHWVGPTVTGSGIGVDLSSLR